MVQPWLRFHIPLIEPDVQISRIRLSDKTSRLCSRVQRLLQFLNTRGVDRLPNLRQITEAFPWDLAPRYLIRDRDSSYGTVVTQRIQVVRRVCPTRLTYQIFER